MMIWKLLCRCCIPPNRANHSTRHAWLMLMLHASCMTGNDTDASSRHLLYEKKTENRGIKSREKRNIRVRERRDDKRRKKRGELPVCVPPSPLPAGHVCRDLACSLPRGRKELQSPAACTPVRAESFEPVLVHGNDRLGRPEIDQALQ